MYTIRLTVRDDEGLQPFKHVPKSSTNDDEAIIAGQAQIADQMPARYTFVQARVCRREEVVWSSDS